MSRLGNLWYTRCQDVFYLIDIVRKGILTMYVQGTFLEPANQWEVYCFKCKTPVARMSAREVGEYAVYLTVANEVPLCFDCEDELLRLREKPSACLVTHISTETPKGSPEKPQQNSRM